MDTTTLRTEISQILETLNEQWEMVEQHEGRIPQIEIDLMQSTIRDLYEALLNLHRKNDEIANVPPPSIHHADIEEYKTIIPEPVYEEPEPFHEIPEPVYEAPEPIIPVNPEPVYHEPEPVIPVSPEPVYYEPEPVIPEPVYHTPEPEIPINPEPVYQAPEPVIPEPVYQAPEPEFPQPQYKPPIDPNEFSFRPPKPDPDLFSPGGPTISDKLKDDKLTLNERLQQEKAGSTLSSRLHQNPIKDLKSSIGINEKFQFINELFNGSMQDYTQGITDLNSFTNYEEALQLIDVLKFKFNWDINSDAYHKIMDFVRRRYM